MEIFLSILTPSHYLFLCARLGEVAGREDLDGQLGPSIRNLVERPWAQCHEQSLEGIRENELISLLLFTVFASPTSLEIIRSRTTSSSICWRKARRGPQTIRSANRNGVKCMVEKVWRSTDFAIGYIRQPVSDRGWKIPRAWGPTRETRCVMMGGVSSVEITADPVFITFECFEMLASRWTNSMLSGMEMHGQGTSTLPVCKRLTWCFAWDRGQYILNWEWKSCTIMRRACMISTVAHYSISALIFLTQCAQKLFLSN
jgi:hypothetical protein